MTLEFVQRRFREVAGKIASYRILTNELRRCFTCQNNTSDVTSPANYTPSGDVAEKIPQIPAYVTFIRQSIVTDIDELRKCTDADKDDHLCINKGLGKQDQRNRKGGKKTVHFDDQTYLKENVKRESEEQTKMRVYISQLDCMLREADGSIWIRSDKNTPLSVRATVKEDSNQLPVITARKDSVESETTLSSCCSLPSVTNATENMPVSKPVLDNSKDAVSESKFDSHFLRRGSTRLSRRQQNNVRGKGGRRISSEDGILPGPGLPPLVDTTKPRRLSREGSMIKRERTWLY